MPDTFFPITHCKVCGAAVRRMDDHLYQLDKVVLHTCDTIAAPKQATLSEDKAHA